MKCFSCDKFIKRGHGTQIWYHPNPNDIRRVGIRGENRYYCSLCLKVKEYWEKMNEEKYKYFISDKKHTYYSLLLFIILALLFYFVKELKQAIILISLITIPIFLIIDYYRYQATKKENIEIAKKRAKLWEQYEKFKVENWRPIRTKKEEMKKIEIYLKNKYPYKEFCCCVECLESEDKKRKQIT